MKPLALTLIPFVSLSAVAGDALPAFVVDNGNSIPVKAIAGDCARVSRVDDTIVLETTESRPNVWPAVYFTFNAPFDLDHYGAVRVTVSNCTAQLTRIGVKIKAETPQGQLPERGFRVLGGHASTCSVPLRIERWVFDRDPKLKGLKRLPKVGNGTSYTLAKTHAISVYLPAGTVNGKFAVSSIELIPGGEEKFQQTLLRADALNPWVDAFGQARFAEFPAKIHQEADFKEQLASENRELDAHPDGIPSADRFGGWTGGPQLAATGFFRTEKVNGKWWFVDPDGHLFISKGINCGWDLTPTAISFREEYFEKLPPRDGATRQFWTEVKKPAYRNYYSDPSRVPYWAFSFQRHNLWLKYGADYLAKNYAMQARRCRAWGINTFTGATLEQRKAANVPYVLGISPSSRKILGAKGYWGELIDPFAPEFEENCRKTCANPWILAAGTNALCIGWTAHNELSWDRDGASLARGVLASPDDQPAKIALLDLLARIDPKAAASTNQIPDAVLAQLGTALAEKYYSTIRRAIKSVAPNHLYLGDRNDKLNPEVFIAASKFCDVITVNTYDYRACVELPAGALDKPLMVTEFHFGCYDTGYFYASLIPVKDQKTRANCFRSYMRSVIDNPNYVGAHWFCWRDQPITGVIGESANSSCGIVSVTDVPYAELVDAMKEVAAEMYTRRAGLVK